MSLLRVRENAPEPDDEVLEVLDDSPPRLDGETVLRVGAEVVGVFGVDGVPILTDEPTLGIAIFGAV